MVLNQLANIREERGMTLEELAAKAGVSSMTIRRAEKGKGTVLNNAKAIARALKVAVTDLTAN